MLCLTLSSVTFHLHFKSISTYSNIVKHTIPWPFQFPEQYESNILTLIHEKGAPRQTIQLHFINKAKSYYKICRAKMNIIILIFSLNMRSKLHIKQVQYKNWPLVLTLKLSVKYELFLKSSHLDLNLNTCHQIISEKPNEKIKGTLMQIWKFPYMLVFV